MASHVKGERWVVRRWPNESSMPEIALDEPKDKIAIFEPRHYFDVETQDIAPESLERMHLAAAAPEMYRVLKHLEKIGRSGCELCGASYARADHFIGCPIVEALAKAEGR